MYVCPECGASGERDGFCTADGAELTAVFGDALLGQSIGSYRIARLVGSGGMGQVYKGVHPTIGSRVAIKVLSAECARSPALVQRFFAEARAVNVVRHEAIVNVLDLLQLPDGRPCIVMEYLDGRPLSAAIRERGALPAGEMARLLGDVLDGLGAAHAHGIIHRDLKPDNVFVTAGGRAKILDFGIAKLRPELSSMQDATRTGALLGTPHYMSPEQALGRSVDHRSDLYSLGLVLYEGLTGKKAFDAPSLYELLKLHVERAPPSPRSLRSELSPALEAVVLRALAKEPGERFASAGEFRSALLGAAAGLPGLSPSVPPSAAPARASPSAPPFTPADALGPTLRVASKPPLAPGSGEGTFRGVAPGTLAAPESRRRSSPLGWLLFVAGGLLVVGGLAVGGGLFVRRLAREARVGIEQDPPLPGLPDIDVDDGEGDDDGPASSGRPGKLARFDVGRYLPMARRRARGHVRDAELTMISAVGVRDDGTIDLKAGITHTVSYHFRSRSGRACVIVSATQFGVQAVPHDGSGCKDDPILLEPRCTPAVVIAKARSEGLEGTPTSILVYMPDEDGKGRWTLTAGALWSRILPDDC
jgi:serine/threonine protein kinase